MYGVLSPDGRFVYTNAGHNAPALLVPGGIRRLTKGGSILGAFPDATFEEETVTLSPGDSVVMFTDGVTEARNAGDEEFGEPRLMAALESEAVSAPAVLLKRTFAAVRDFCGAAEQGDDVTVVVIRLLQSSY